VPESTPVPNMRIEATSGLTLVGNVPGLRTTPVVRAAEAAKNLLLTGW
jgi:hypothetical protein